MKAILTEGFGEIDVLHLANIESPACGPDEVVIKTCASGINGADLLQRRGQYPPPADSSPLLGLEVSGTIETLGPIALQKGLQKSQRVIALLSGGGYAEKVVVRHDQIMLLPDSLDLVQAGGIAEVFLTAYLELIWLGQLKQGQRVLIHAGASGVGSAAIQIAHSIGAEIWVTASSEEKLNFCKDLGAHHLINYKTQDFVKVIEDQCNRKGIHCILDLVGAVHFKANLKALGVEGKLLLVGLGSGSLSEIDLRILLAKRLQIIGSTLRSRSLEEKAKLIHEFWQYAKPRFDKGEWKPLIDKIFSPDQVQSAHAFMEKQANKGKLLLHWK